MNIRLFACALLSACVFVSCHSDKAVEDIETVSYTFQVINPITGSLDDFDTRAGEASTPSCLCVYDVPDGEAPNDVVYRENDVNALAPIKLQLTPGKHRICFLCSSSPWTSIETSTLNATWDKSLSDVWSTVIEVDVQSGASNVSQTVKLDRVVAYVGVKIKDALSKIVTTMHQELEGGTWTFDMLKQVGGMTNKIILDTKVPNGDLGNPNREYGLYTFVPEGAESALSYTITAQQGYEVIQSYTINHVPLTPNQYTIYEGEFFTPNNHNQVSIELERDWNTVKYDFEGNRLND
ncbi:MAG: hypothetical protein J6X31_00500 [Bacteroidales bacterium]|nr:hypothetical protein [Bacteroidales bacterium]